MSVSQTIEEGYYTCNFCMDRGSLKPGNLCVEMTGSINVISFRNQHKVIDIMNYDKYHFYILRFLGVKLLFNSFLKYMK